MSYGPVRPLADTLRSLGLLPKKKQQITESRDAELVARKNIAEQVRKSAVAPKTAPSKVSVPSKPSASRQILEEIEALQSTLRKVVHGTDVNADAKEILANVGQFCESAIKRYGWRKDEKSQKLAKVFEMMKQESVNIAGKIGGELSESNDVKSSVRECVRVFAEAVRQVRDAFPVSEETLSQIEAKVK